MEKKNSNSCEYVYYMPNSKDIELGESTCRFKTYGIKSRFQEQYNDLIQRMCTENYHK